MEKNWGDTPSATLNCLYAVNLRYDVITGYECLRLMVIIIAFQCNSYRLNANVCAD